MRLIALLFILSGVALAQIDTSLPPDEACTFSGSAQDTCLLEYSAALDFESATANDAIGGFIIDGLAVAMWLAFCAIGFAIGGFGI